MGRGRPEPRKPAVTVEALARGAIDVNELKRAGLLRDARMTLQPGFGRWPRILRLVSERYWLDLYLADTSAPQEVQISWTRCHLGGFRPWMHCPHPHCRKRVGKLLPGMGGYYCRECVGSPLYASQAKSRNGRIHFEICKVRLLLDGQASLQAPFPERPRGMHRQTYARMRERAIKLEANLPRKHRGKQPDYRNLAYYLD